MRLQKGGDTNVLGTYKQETANTPGQLKLSDDESVAENTIDRTNYFDRVLNVTTIAVSIISPYAQE